MRGAAARSDVNESYGCGEATVRTGADILIVWCLLGSVRNTVNQQESCWRQETLGEQNKAPHPFGRTAVEIAYMSFALVSSTIAAPDTSSQVSSH